MVELRYAKDMRWLHQTAMLLFPITTGLGMSRDLWVVRFEDHNVLLTHPATSE